MPNIILTILICIACFFGGVLFKKLKQAKIDNQYYEELNKLNQQKQDLSNSIIKFEAETEIQKAALSNELNDLKNNKELLNSNISSLMERKTSIDDDIKKLEDTYNKISDAFYQQTMDNARSKIGEAIDQEEKRINKISQDYQDAYKELMADLTFEYQSAMTNNLNDINDLQGKIEIAKNQLEDLQRRTKSAIESRAREELLKSEKEYYKCQISDVDKEEIHRFREIEPFLRNSRPLCKIIWESYYKDPVDELLNRIVGNETATGIYKITNLVNNKVYIGQAVSLKSRLTDHIKCGLGIDPNNSQLYIDMKQYGPENFMFEVLQRCENIELNDLEKYWIEFFQAVEHGYNVTKGGSQNRFDTIKNL